MGACNEATFPDIFPSLYTQHRPETVQRHFLAVIELEFFQDKKARLLHDAQFEAQELASKILGQIKVIQDECQVLYRQKLSFFEFKSENLQKMEFIQSKSDIETELLDLRQKFTDLKDALKLFFQDFATQLTSYLEEEMFSIKRQIEQKLIKIIYSDQLKKQHVEYYFQRLRRQLSRQIQKRCREIQFRVGNCLNSDVFVKVTQTILLDDQQINQKLNQICRIFAQNGHQLFRLRKGFLKLIVTDSDDEQEDKKSQKSEFWKEVNEKQKSICDLLDLIKADTDTVRQTLSSFNTQFVKSQKMNSSVNSLATNSGQSRPRARSNLLLPPPKLSKKQSSRQKSKKSLPKNKNQLKIPFNKLVK